MEEDINGRLSRFLTATLVMLVCAVTALGHAAVSLKARAAQTRAYARHR